MSNQENQTNTDEGQSELTAVVMCSDHAISVIDESDGAYYDGFKDLPDDVKKRVSAHMLSCIFKSMVMPAIDQARFIDRHGYSNRPTSKTIETMMLESGSADT